MEVNAQPNLIFQKPNPVLDQKTLQAIKKAQQTPGSEIIVQDPVTGEHSQIKLEDVLTKKVELKGDRPAKLVLQLADQQSLVIDLKNLSLEHLLESLELTHADPQFGKDIQEKARDLITHIRKAHPDLRGIQQAEDQELTKLAQAKSRPDLSRNPLNAKFWQNPMGQLSKAIGSLNQDDPYTPNPKAQKEVSDIYWKMHRLIKNNQDQNGLLSPNIARELHELYQQALKIAGSSFQQSSDDNEMMGKIYAGGLFLAQTARDLAANTVNNVADRLGDKLPALKGIAAGMNGTLAFIDTIAEDGWSAESFSKDKLLAGTIRGAVYSVLSLFKTGDDASTQKKIATTLSKVIALTISDMTARLAKGESVDKAEFGKTFMAHMGQALVEAGLDRVIKSSDKVGLAPEDVIKASITTLYDRIFNQNLLSAS